jgi:hypothetical protein
MRQPGPPDGNAAASIVDESRIDEMLALSPEERLRENDRMVRTLLLLQQNDAAPDDRISPSIHTP